MMQQQIFNNIKTFQNSNPVKFYMWITIGLYIAIYSIFLYVSDFLPYVFDNNETYSSLVHAYNMYFGDWNVHFGLADDAFSHDPAAHPAIHTHQGNWPRIFAYILFALGARSAESQIFLHTFTIGLVSIWLMFRFFNNIANSRFALLACLVFMTDYILFAQWQVVTYRIWHVFFVFLSLNCTQEFNSSNKLWKLLFVFNFVALYYGELVFAFFLSMWSLLYYAYLVSCNIKKVLKFGLLIAVSGTFSLCVLLAQLSMYMGFDNAILDFTYTFLSRNFSGSEMDIKQQMLEFYSKMNIAFWNNAIDGSKFRTVNEFLRSLFAYGFQFHTPILVLQAFFAVFCIGLSSIQTNTVNKIPGILKINLSIATSRRVTAICMLLFMFVLFFDNKFMGISPQREFYSNGSVAMAVLLPVFSWILSGALFNMSRPFGGKVHSINVVFVNAFILVSTLLILVLPTYYEQSYSVIWFKYLTGSIPITMWRLLTIYIVFSCALHLILNRDLLKNFLKNRAIFAFLGAALISYAVIYLLSPGYVFTGYLIRTAPFVVFFIDVILALFIWYMLQDTLFQLRLSRNFPYNASQRIVSLRRCLSTVLAIGLPGIICYQWLHTQYAYYNIFPSTSINFIKQFRQPSFNNKTIITNQYAVPFSYEINNWAYNGNNYGAGTLELSKDGFGMPHVIEYMWYKNRNDYAGYKKPDYYVCFAPNTYDSGAHELRMITDRARRCSTNRVVSQAMLVPSFAENDQRLRHTILDADKSIHDVWAIVKMDWEYPPFFAAQKNNKKYYDVSYDKANKTLHLTYIFRQQSGMSELQSKFKILEYTASGKQRILAEFVGHNGNAVVKLNQNPQGTIEIIGVPFTESKSGPIFRQTVDIATK